jgi:hypothetical protein
MMQVVMITCLVGRSGRSIVIRPGQAVPCATFDPPTGLSQLMHDHPELPL